MKALIAAAALSTAFVATGCQANPYPALAAGTAQVQTVQYWYDDASYAPPPRRYYRPRPPAYYEDPGYGYYGPPRGYYRQRDYYRPRAYYYDRDAAKDYVKDYRRAQKEIFKDQVRGWNRAHGF